MSNRGGTAGGRPTNPGITLPSGQKVCPFWQTNTCREQSLQYCTRNTGKYLHVCSFIKTGGVVCGKKDHKKSEHDVNKH